MSAPSWSTSAPVRVAAAGVCGLAVLASVSLAGTVRERADLPKAAHQLILATDDASAVTSCLQGARDEIYIPGSPPLLHDRIAVGAAERRLAGCDIDSLARDLDAIHVPPAAPITVAKRRLARADIVNAVAVLQRVVLDARAADRLMRASLAGAPNATSVVLAYNSSNTGSDVAYRYAVEASALLGDPQSTVNG
jgi:hypothetical protein